MAPTVGWRRSPRWVAPAAAVGGAGRSGGWRRPPRWVALAVAVGGAVHRNANADGCMATAPPWLVVAPAGAAVAAARLEAVARGPVLNP